MCPSILPCSSWAIKFLAVFLHRDSKIKSVLCYSTQEIHEYTDKTTTTNKQFNQPKYIMPAKASYEIFFTI